MARPVGRERVSELSFSRERLSLCFTLGIFVGLLFVIYGHKPRFGHSSVFALSYHQYHLIISIVDIDTSFLPKSFVSSSSTLFLIPPIRVVTRTFARGTQVCVRETKD